MRKDYLKYINVELLQDETMFSINTDTTILGSFLDPLIGKSVLDIGTNNGALLLYAAYFGANKLYGVDINQKALALAQENLKQTNKEVHLYCGKIQDLQLEKVDAIICNPPFFDGESTRTDENMKLAMFEDSLPLEQLFQSFRKCLKDNGCVYVIYPAERFMEFVQMAQIYKMKFMRLRFVHDKNKIHALRFVAKLKIGKMNKVKIEEPIYIENGEIINNNLHNK